MRHSMPSLPLGPHPTRNQEVSQNDLRQWFDQTLPPFFAQHPEPIAFISHDCDPYEAAKIVFQFTADRLRPGTLIIFDDYWGYRGWKSGEHKAWRELVEERKIAYQYLAFAILQVFVKITSLR
jgi:hypothetical protein